MRWKLDKSVVQNPLHVSKEVSSYRSSGAISVPRLNNGPGYDSVVNIARILVAAGVRDRAVERTVRAAAAVTAAAAAAAETGTDAASIQLQKTHLLPPLNSVSNECAPTASAHARRLPGHSLSSLPSLDNTLLRTGKSSLRGNLGVRSSDKDSDDICELPNVTALHVRSIHCARSSGGSASPAPSTRWQPSPLPSLSASPLPPAHPGSQHFKQIFRFADNDLSAPFRQDVTIKRPTLHLMTPADAAVEKMTVRHDALLQETLKQSNLLGPGHLLAAGATGVHTNLPTLLSAALGDLSKQHATRVQEGGTVRRNFALS
jgi:hypothetical protein